MVRRLCVVCGPCPGRRSMRLGALHVTVRGVAIEIAVWASPALISKCGREIGRSPAFDFYSGWGNRKSGVTRTQGHISSRGAGSPWLALPLGPQGQGALSPSPFTGTSFLSQFWQRELLRANRSNRWSWARQGPGPRAQGHAPWKGTDPLFEQKGWCQFPGSFELDFLRKPRKVLT